MNELKGVKIGYAMTGSFCTFEKSYAAAGRLIEAGAELTPIFSFNAASIDTRFGTAREWVEKMEILCEKSAIRTIEEAEPIGPKGMFDIIAVAPCTGNTLAKLALSIVDTPVTMAVKSHLRNSRPVIIAVSTNDALAGTAKNVGALMNYRNYYFVPLREDDYIKKPTSAVADYEKLPEAILNALNGIQIQPLIFS